jgi:hypothetical protein
MVVKRPKRVQVDFDFLLQWDSLVIRNAATKPRGMGIVILKETVITDRRNNPISFINKKDS